MADLPRSAPFSPYQVRQLRGQLPQPAQGDRGLALDRAYGDAEHLGGAGLAAVFEEAQHQHSALLGREPGQGLGEDDPELGRVAAVGRPLLGHLRHRELTPLPAPPRDGVPVEDRAQVRLRLPVAQLPPAQGDLDQRGLQQVLGQVPVAADEERRPLQPRLARLGERGKAGVRLGGIRGHATRTYGQPAGLGVPRFYFRRLVAVV